MGGRSFNITSGAFWALYYEVYKLASNMPKLQKGRKPLKNTFLSLLLSNQKEIRKRGLP